MSNNNKNTIKYQIHFLTEFIYFIQTLFAILYFNRN